MGLLVTDVVNRMLCFIFVNAITRYLMNCVNPAIGIIRWFPSSIPLLFPSPTQHRQHFTSPPSQLTLGRGEYRTEENLKSLDYSFFPQSWILCPNRSKLCDSLVGVIMRKKRMMNIGQNDKDTFFPPTLTEHLPSTSYSSISFFFWQYLIELNCSRTNER